MLVMVFSDTHGNTEPMFRAVKKYNPDMVLHLGDHASDAQELEDRFPGLDVRYVRGNCDFLSKAPDKELLEVEGLRIFMTHGHEYSVKFTLDSLLNAAHFSGVQLALFGHTHRPFCEERDGVLLVNPGAAMDGHFAILTVENGSVSAQLY